MDIENQGATADVEATDKSMDDTIRETLASMRERGMEPHADIGDDSAEAAAGRARDEAGRFAKAEAKAAETPPEEVALDAPTSATEPATVAVEEPEIAAAPNTWKKEAQATWNALPPEARREIQRREQDFHKGIEQYKQAAEFAKEFGRAVQPFEATLRTNGIHPVKAFEALLSSDHLLRYGTPSQKAQKLADMASYYGIDPSAVSATESTAQVDPQVAALKQQVDQLSGYLQQQQFSSQQAEEATLHSEIARFAADPAHTHFEAVKGHMSALLQAGLAQTLDDAYAQAVRANPQTYAAAQQQHAQAQREEANRKAAAAKQAASVNVRSRPAMPAGIPQGQTIEETARENYRRLMQA